MDRPAVRRFSISASSEGILVTACSLAFAVLFSLPLLEHLTDAFFVDDWDYFRDHDWSDLRTVTYFHQFPLWSPYQCGGMQALASPQSRMLSPFFLLHLIAGSTVGMNLEIPLHLAIAWAGGYVLARSLHLGKFAAVGCATVFPSSSWFYLHMGVGQLDFVAFTYSPWIVAFTLIAIERKGISWAAAAGLILALAFFEGGVHPVAQTVVLLMMLAVIAAAMQRDPWPLTILVAVGLFALGFGAVKLLPTLFLAIQYSRPTSADQYLSLGACLSSLFSREQAWYRTLQWLDVGSMSFTESGTYLSPAFLIVALAGVWAAPRRSLPWILMALAFLVLGTGSRFGPCSPWVLVHRLPVFSWFRIPPRYFVLLPLCVAVLTGFGVEWMNGWKPPFGVLLAIVLLASGTIDTWLICPQNLFVGSTAAEPATPKSPVFRQFSGPNQQMFSVNNANMGISNCYNGLMVPLGFVTASNQPGYKGEEYLLGPGMLQLSRWTPNVLDYDVEVKSPTIMVVNENYDSPWTLLQGRGEVFSYNGLLAVRLPAGRQRLELAYRSYPFLAGIVIFCLTMLVVLLIMQLEYVSGEQLPARWPPRRP